MFTVGGPATAACARASAGPRLLLVPAALLLAGVRPLQPPELLLRPAQEPRGADLGAIGQHRERGQPQVDAYLPARLREAPRISGRVGLDHERREVPARRVPDHRHAGRLARQRPRPPHRNVADLRQPQPPVRQDLEPRVGGEPDSLPPVLAGPQPGRPDPLGLALTLKRGEKVPVGRVQVGQRLLEHHRGHLRQPLPLRRLLGRGQPRRQLRVGEVRPPGLVRVLPGTQPVVEHHPRAAERPRQRRTLAAAHG